MMLVCVGLIIVSLILLFVYKHTEKDWICNLAVVLDIISLIIAFFGLAGSINRDKLNNKQDEVIDMNEYVIYFDCGFSSTDIPNDGYAVIYATDVRSALDQFESEYDSVDTIREIDVR